MIKQVEASETMLIQEALNESFRIFTAHNRPAAADMAREAIRRLVDTGGPVSCEIMYVTRSLTTQARLL